MIDLWTSAPWGSLLACLAVATVLLFSVQMKFADYPSFVAWANTGRSRHVNLLVEKGTIPAEVGAILLLVIFGFRTDGALLAALVAGTATAAAWLSDFLMGGKRCACFGKASLSGTISPGWVFGTLALLSLAIAVSGAAAGARIPTFAASTAWLVVPFASSAVAARMQSPRFSVADLSDKAVTPDFREMLSAHVPPGNQHLPCAVLFTAKGCPSCRDIAEPFEQFARAFPGNARYFVFERGGSHEGWASGGVVHLSASNAEIPKTMGVTGYPCALLLKHGPASTKARPFDNADGVRSMLATLIRPTPVESAGGGASLQNRAA